MELPGYRENLAYLQELFPGAYSITVSECAKALGVNINTIYSSFDNVKNPLPKKIIGKNRIIIPIPQLARYMCRKD